jgi:predicted DNA-binding transcriptional regulator YafY
MRRADRLFEIVQLLRGGRLRTARDLAGRLEVSTRTIWRDIADLQAQGVPIDGERGVGYLLRDEFFLPPLALTGGELEALAWGVRLVEAYGDPDLAEAARELQVKIAAVGLTDKRGVACAMDAFAGTPAQAAKDVLAVIRTAIADVRKLDLSYRDLKGASSRRVVRPLHLDFWGQVWTLAAWCETRDDFRVFRCDRIQACTETEERFMAEDGKRLSDFLAAMKAKDGMADAGLSPEPAAQ